MQFAAAAPRPLSVSGDSQELVRSCTCGEYIQRRTESTSAKKRRNIMRSQQRVAHPLETRWRRLPARQPSSSYLFSRRVATTLHRRTRMSRHRPTRDRSHRRGPQRATLVTSPAALRSQAVTTRGSGQHTDAIVRRRLRPSRCSRHVGSAGDDPGTYPDRSTSWRTMTNTNVSARRDVVHGVRRQHDTIPKGSGVNQVAGRSLPSCSALADGTCLMHASTASGMSAPARVKGPHASTFERNN